MKKIFFFFMLLVLCMSCTKDIVDMAADHQSTVDEVVNFSASMVELVQSKAVTIKTDWADGDQIAVFVDGEDQNPRCYDVDKDGVMTLVDGFEPFLIMHSDTLDYIYHAFYPYNEDLSSLADYEAFSSETVDILSSVSSGCKTVEFQFSHDMSLLYFSFLSSVENKNELEISLAMDGDLSNAVDLNVDVFSGSIANSYTASIFVEPQDDISSVIMGVAIGDNKSYYDLVSPESSEWKAGHSYTYKNINLGAPVGLGTQDDPYIVYFLEDMYKIGTGTDGWELSSHYKLGFDFDLSGTDDNQWLSIGTADAPFTGSLDGNGHALTLAISYSDSTNVGLFGYIDGSTIKNLTVRGRVEGFLNVGGIVGYASNITIDNCCNEAEVVSFNSYVGGLVGYASNITIDNCCNEAEVLGYSLYAGGLVGFAEQVSVSNSYNEAKVSARQNVGGLIGYAYLSSTISDCYNTAEIYGSGQGIGGIVGGGGYLDIINSYNTAVIKSNLSNVGGLAGFLNLGSIVNSYNLANVSATKNVGGIVGSMSESQLYNCYNTAGVLATEVKGGIVGYAESSTIGFCFNNSDNYNGNFVGLNSEDGSTIFDTSLKTTEQMLSSDFVQTLNIAAYLYNAESTNVQKIYGWAEVSGDYPTFDADAVLSFETGSGTDSDPYLIYTSSDLRKVGTGTDGWDMYAHYKLVRDIDLGGIDVLGNGVVANEWMPVIAASKSSCFKGTFDGDGYMISGLYINQPETSAIGLFGYIRNATIKNLSVSGSITGSEYIGGIAGTSDDVSNIYNCHNYASVEAQDGFVGGIVGEASKLTTSASSGALINACSNKGSIKGTRNVAGIVGYASTSYIFNSYNTGTISATSSQVGGIAGGASSVVNCYNRGTVSSGSEYTLGGVLGYLYEEGSAYNCYNSSSVTCSGGNVMGGVIGTVYTSCYARFIYVDSDKFSGEAIYDQKVSATVSDVGSKTTEQICSSEFVELLNIGVVACNNMGLVMDVYDWTLGDDGYPVIDLGNIPSSGSGTESDPFLVCSSSDMSKVGSDIDGWSLSSHYKLCFDIDLAGSEDSQWTPIGSSSTAFSGLFDGDNHLVSGLYINSESDNQGLFGFASGTIQNLGVSGQVTGASYVGGIVGFTTSSVYNCYNEATIIGTGSEGFVGGILGRTFSDSYIKNCYNTGDVTGTTNVGGVAGLSYNYISDCYNKGQVTGTGTSSSSVGGVIGYSSAPHAGTSSVLRCYNTNTGTVSGMDNVGGIVGKTYGTEISNCYNKAAVSGDGSYVGGLVGCLSESSELSNSYSTSTVSGADVVGGVIGYIDNYYSDVRYCYYNSDNYSGSAIGDSMIIDMTDVSSKDMDEMQASGFVTLLNTSQSDMPWSIDTADTNDGYPVLTPNL